MHQIPFMTGRTLYTVGHSNQTFEDLLGMLQAQHINVIVDVRSVPASKYTPQFNQKPLQAALRREGIHYLHFGYEFGARRTDALDADNKVDFEKAVLTPAFQEGVKRLTDGLNKGFRISLMCSEANPLECHRFTTIPHQQLQDEMVKEYVRKKKIPEVQPPDMFGENECTKEQQIVLAYRQKNKEIAYQQETEEYYV